MTDIASIVDSVMARLSHKGLDGNEFMTRNVSRIS